MKKINHSTINEFSVAKSRLRKSFSQDAINKLVVKLSSQLLDRLKHY